MCGSAVPLLRVAFVMLFEGGAQRLKECCNRVVLGVSKSKAKGELAVGTQVQFPVSAMLPSVAWSNSQSI